jgi:heat shock protein HslJ
MKLYPLLPLCSLVLLGACAEPSAPPPLPPAASQAAAPIPAAKPAAAAAAPDTAVLGLWLIEQARSAPLLDKRSARLDFGPDGTLSGNGSCNTLSGRYTLEGNKLAIGPIVTTRKACSEALMDQEDRVLTALERAARAAVPPHGFLTLWDADGAVLLRASRL